MTVVLPETEEEFQKRYFDSAKHQYPPAAILNPPLHTQLELDRVLDRLDGVRGDGQIVDFGSGTGRLATALAKAGYAVLAVDVSDRSLIALAAVAHDLGLPAIKTAPMLPSRRQFPAIVGADVLHHVDLDTYLPQFYASLLDGGKVIFSEPGALNPAWYVYLTLFHELRVERRIVTCNVFTLRRKFERYGFRDVRITGLGLLPRPLFKWARIACRWHDGMGNWPIVKWFAYRYIIEARK